MESQIVDVVSVMGALNSKCLSLFPVKEIDSAVY